ncbi:VIT1/CCC1 transporter family protein [Saccharopolyspora gloriosae]
MRSLTFFAGPLRANYFVRMVATNEHDGTDEIGHTHADVSGGWLRPAVFGAMDGLVTNIALVAGVGGAGANGHFMVLSGTAGLVAGAFSMALGEYSSVETQNNSVRSESVKERAELVRDPVGERAELADMFVEDGMSRETAERAAAEIHENTDQAVRTHLVHELGVDPQEQPSPLVAAGSSFLCFAMGALIPLLPFLAGADSLPLGLLAGAIGLFISGALVARFTTRPWWWNGTRQLLFGALAAGATFLVGQLIGVSAA